MGSLFSVSFEVSSSSRWFCERLFAVLGLLAYCFQDLVCLVDLVQQIFVYRCVEDFPKLEGV
jgi:hypothetical protein